MMTRRVSAALLAAVVGAIVAGIVVALADPQTAYSWWDNMLSDLGDATCRTWGEQWICSPRYRWFNAGLIAAGVFLCAASVRLRATWGGLLALSMGAAAAGLVLLGVFPSDVAHDLHMAGAVLALPAPGLGLLLSGIAPGGVRSTVPRRWRAALGVAVLMLSLVQLLPAHVSAPRGAAEFASLVALLGFLAAESAGLWRRRRPAA